MANNTTPSNSNITAGSVVDASAIISWTANVEGVNYIDYGTTTGYGTTATIAASLTIGNVQTIPTKNSVTISWDLTVAGTPTVGTGQVNYGTSTSYGASSAAELSFSYSSHSQVITGLASGTPYHFQIISANANGDVSTSQDYTFTTLPALTILPPSSNLADVQIYYTGGSSNTVDSASIGGAISNTRIYSQLATPKTTFPGIAFINGVGNREGTGYLSWFPATHMLYWQAPGDTLGAGQFMNAADGIFFIPGVSANGLAVSVTYASLPASNLTVPVSISNIKNVIFSTQTKVQSDSGQTRYRCIAVKNGNTGLSIADVRFYINQNTIGADTISLWLDPLAFDNGTTTYPTAVANENTAPINSTFVLPDSNTSSNVLLLGDLPPLQVKFVWLKQSSPVVTTTVLGNAFKIGMSMKG